MSDLNDKLCEKLHISLIWECAVNEYPGEEDCQGIGSSFCYKECPHEVTEIYPNLAKQVDVTCGDKNCLDGYIPSQPDGEPVLCPTCNGNPVRLITRLQQVLEGNGEWINFYRSIFERFTITGNRTLIQSPVEIFTDANAMLRAYAEFKGWSDGT